MTAKDDSIEEEIIDLDNGIQVKANWSYEKIPLNPKIKLTSEEDEIFEEIVHITFSTTYPENLVLQWGTFTLLKKYDWVSPSVDLYPPNTKPFNQTAVETEFERDEEGLKKINLRIPTGSVGISSIGGINFVFHDKKTGKWYNNNRKDFSIKFRLKVDHKDSRKLVIEKLLAVPGFVDDIINCEARYGSWTLMHRYNKCFGLLNSIDILDNENMIWIFIWLRYSYQRLLDWQRNFNTKPKELAGSQSRFTHELSQKYSWLRSKESPFLKFQYPCSSLAKQCLSMVGKGTGDGQRIRDEILAIMHKHNISETPNHFYEQWHQKLHNNTTPDDVVICQGLINFLRTGRIEEYRNTLSGGGITRQRMENFERKITAEPYYQPAYLWDFERFLHTLKAIHASTDLVLMYHSAKYAFGYNQIFEDIIRYKDDWDTLKQMWRVTDGRRFLEGVIQGTMLDIGRLRDVLFLDVSLEIHFRQLVERIIHVPLDIRVYISEVTAILTNIKLSFHNFIEIGICYDDWIHICENLKHDQSIYATLKIKSVCDRLLRLLSKIVDYFNLHFDPKAKYIGHECGIDKYYVGIFTEEILRGSSFFALSSVLKKIEPILRRNANLGPWLTISGGLSATVSGKLTYLKSLQEVKIGLFKETTILITNEVGGNEEVPDNCSCLIIIKTTNYPDILAHVSVRARNLGIPFIVCFDENISNHLLSLVGQNVLVKISNRGIDFEKVDEDKLNSMKMKMDNEKESSSKSEKENKKNLAIPEGFTQIIMEMQQFTPECVGAKANNTKKVYGNNILNWLKYPDSIAIPYNVDEYFLNFNENQEIRDELAELTGILISEEGGGNIDIPKILKKCRNKVKEIHFVSDEETEKLRKRLIDFGIDEKSFDKAFQAIKGVWASKYNDRAYIATRQVGIKLEDIRMAVLVQRIIPADYAYVIHSKNPLTNDENEVYAEMVVGMGETLVGSYEGQSLSFTVNKKSKAWNIKTYPNKSICLKNEGFIFRSDSNTEDLEGFAGAGIFDTVPMVEHREIPMTYHNNPLIYDYKFVEYAIQRIAEIGIVMEELYNYPQDIEGVIYHNEFYIVQTRPQV